MSEPAPVYLFDKNVVRRIVAGMVKVQADKRLTQEEDDALALLQEARKGSLHLFIAPEAFNLLRRFTGRAEVDLFLEIAEVMQAGRYFKRWARRLRGYGFTPEDAKVLSLGTFGTRKAGDILGVDAIITFDQLFIVSVHVGCESSDFRSLGRNFSQQYALKNGQLALICKVLWRLRKSS